MTAATTPLDLSQWILALSDLLPLSQILVILVFHTLAHILSCLGFPTCTTMTEHSRNVLLVAATVPGLRALRGAHPAWQGANGTEFARNGSRTWFLR